MNHIIRFFIHRWVIKFCVKEISSLSEKEFFSYLLSLFFSCLGLKSMRWVEGSGGKEKHDEENERKTLEKDSNQKTKGFGDNENMANGEYANAKFGTRSRRTRNERKNRKKKKKRKK